MEGKRYVPSETWCHKRILRTSRTEHRTIEELFRRVRKIEHLFENLEKKESIGHVIMYPIIIIEYQQGQHKDFCLRSGPSKI